jgi:hypothetical protein
MKRILEYEGKAFCHQDYEAFGRADCEVWIVLDTEQGPCWEHIEEVMLKLLNVKKDDFWQGKLHIIVEVAEALE